MSEIKRAFLTGAFIHWAVGVFSGVTAWFALESGDIDSFWWSLCLGLVNLLAALYLTRRAALKAP